MKLFADYIDVLILMFVYIMVYGDCSDWIGALIVTEFCNFVLCRQ